MKIKKTLIIAGALVLALGLSACKIVSEPSEYQQGYEQGFIDGKYEGYEEGLADGHDDVIDDPEKYISDYDEDAVWYAYDEGYQDCMDDYGIVDYYG